MKGSRRAAPRSPSVFVFGAGKVGTGLSIALRRAGLEVTLRAQRRGLPRRPIDADVVILAVRDPDIARVAEELARRRLVGARPQVVVHCAGSLGPEPLRVVRGPRVAVAQMHPMISFAKASRPPALDRGQLHADGDPPAVRAIRALGARLGMRARTIRGLDRVAYHAAAGLVANGAAALAAGGLEVLEKAGVDRRVGAAMLGPLLRSVAENVEALGLPEALTGPVRRGDAAGVEKHLAALARLAPRLVSFYAAAGLAQLPLSRALGEGSTGALESIERSLSRALRASSRRPS